MSALIPYGMDGWGRMVHVEDVPRGKDCGLFCPSCKAQLVARKGAVKQHHLAHFSGKPTCEGWLHSTAKNLLAQRIADAMAASRPLPVTWPCNCDGWEWSFETTHHDADLLGKGCMDSVRVECHLSAWNVRPDIVLFSGESAKVVVEIVDSHAPETPVVATGLPVLEVHISESSNLQNLVNGSVLVNVMHNYPCPDPVCSICGLRRSEGHRYCEHCKRDVSDLHSYCGECRSCFDGGHRHRFCELCGLVVVEHGIGLPDFGHGGWSHIHCERCGQILTERNSAGSLTRSCGCPKDFCRRCWGLP